jgi:hypothetical protein
MANQFDEVDVVTHRLAIGSQKGIRPKVPRVLIDQRMLWGKSSDAIFLLTV